MSPLLEAMSGNHWSPAVTGLSVDAGVGQLTPSGELRTKILAWPPGRSALHTTCTPVASAATADRLANRSKVNPEGQVKGPSPQSWLPLPLNWLESNGVNVATLTGAPKEAPPSVDLASQPDDVHRRGRGGKRPECQVDIPVRPHGEVGELSAAHVHRGDADGRRERHAVIGGAGEQDDIVRGEPVELGPGHVDVASVQAAGLIHR